MEYSKVTALNEEERVTEKRLSYHYLYPCDLLEETVKAMFKCFGIDITSHADNELEPDSTTGANPTKTDPSTPELQVADPSEPTDAADDDPPSSIPETTEIAAASTRVGRTTIGSGRGPQIN